MSVHFDPRVTPPLKGSDEDEVGELKELKPEEVPPLIKTFQSPENTLRCEAHISIWKDPHAPTIQVVEAVYERTTLTGDSILLRFFPSEPLYFSDGYLGHFSNVNFHLIDSKGDRIIDKEHIFFKAKDTFYSLTKRTSLVQATQYQDHPSIYSIKEISYKIIYK